MQNVMILLLLCFTTPVLLSICPSDPACGSEWPGMVDLSVRWLLAVQCFLLCKVIRDKIKPMVQVLTSGDGTRHAPHCISNFWTRPSFRPFVAPIKVSWWYHKRFKSHHIDKHRNRHYWKHTTTSLLRCGYVGANKGKGLNTCYSAACMWQTRNSRRSGRWLAWINGAAHSPYQQTIDSFLAASRHTIIAISHPITHNA